MKAIALLLCLLLVLSGCATAVNDQRVLVSIVETEGCTVEANGQRVLPGENAVFRLHLDRGLSLTGTDYPGHTRMEPKGQEVQLTLLGVCVPTRVHLELSHDSVQITYHPNGAEGAAVTESRSLSIHKRPNTATDLFAREGHTLLCWNTEPDGTGIRVGLGSRVTVTGDSLELYAQWAGWNGPEDFDYTCSANSAAITGWKGTSDTIVIPETLDGLPVTAIETGAFQNTTAETVILPRTLETLAEGAFENAAFHTLVLFDSIETLSDSSFANCHGLRTLYINAAEAPFGYTYRKESCYADKADLLLTAQGKQKLVFYGGCSMWYNLDGYQAAQAVEGAYQIINMGLNGTVNSAVQMQILGALMEPGDVLFHTPELSSPQQVLTVTDMAATDKSLWSGIENNYDLFSLVDLTTVGGVFDSLSAYLERKDTRTTYSAQYTDEQEQTYLDAWGGIPFNRYATVETLADEVFLDPARLDDASLERLREYYQWYESRGIRVYLGYACVNLDAVPADQRDNVRAVAQRWESAMEDFPVLGQLEDFLYHREDFYDTNYHLLTDPAKENTAKWLEVLLPQLEQDGKEEGI